MCFRFWKKQKVVQKEQKLVPIRKRLLRLWKYFNICDLTGKIQIIESNEWCGVKYLQFFFETNLGPVKISTTLNEALLPVAFPIVEFEYENYAGTTVFKIETSSPSTTEIEPLLNEDFGAHEIDLAILELEEYLYNTYGDIDPLWDKHIQDENKAKEEHERQIKILEGK